MKVLAILAALAVPPAIYFPTLAAWRNRQIAQAEAEVGELELRLELARAAQRKLPQFREELSRLDEEVAKLRRILPPDMEVDQIRALAEEKSAARGVTLTRFDPRPGTAREQAIDVELIGSAAAIAALLRNIENAARILDVSHVTLRPVAAGWRADLILTGYAMPDAR